MDPDVALDYLLEWAATVVAGSVDVEDARDAGERVLALHDWIMRGGFLPRPWEAARYLDVAE